MKTMRIVGGAWVKLMLGMSVLAVVGCTATVPPPPPNTTPCPVQCSQSYSACRAGCPPNALGDDPCLPNCADAYTACMQQCSGTETP
jgi:hypothetical protein